MEKRTACAHPKQAQKSATKAAYLICWRYINWGWRAKAHKKKECQRRQIGAAGGDRTHDPWLRRPILYPLSYSRAGCRPGDMWHALHAHDPACKGLHCRGLSGHTAYKNSANARARKRRHTRINSLAHSLPYPLFHSPSLHARFSGAHRHSAVLNKQKTKTTGYAQLHPSAGPSATCSGSPSHAMLPASPQAK